jgi:hypothetical protein
LGNGQHLEKLTIDLKGEGDAIDRIPAQLLDEQGLKIKLMEIS